MKQTPDKLWTIDDVAKFCQVKPSVVRYWVRQHKITHFRIGRQVRFDPKDIREWLENRKASTWISSGHDGLKEIL